MKIQGTKKKVHIPGLTDKNVAKKKVTKHVKHLKGCKGDNPECQACKQNLPLPVKLPKGTARKYSKDVQAAIDAHDKKEKANRGKKAKVYTERDLSLIDLEEHRARLSALESEKVKNLNLIASYKKIIADLSKELKVA